MILLIQHGSLLSVGALVRWCIVIRGGTDKRSLSVRWLVLHAYFPSILELKQLRLYVRHKSIIYLTSYLHWTSSTATSIGLFNAVVLPQGRCKEQRSAAGTH